MYDVIIIGGGPAGLTSAIYSTRKKLKTLLLTLDIGGQISKTHKIENYPGIIESTGADLAMTFKQQAENFGSEIKYEQVIEIKKQDQQFEIKTFSNKYLTKTLILAFGKQPMELSVPGENEFKGKGVTYCATCDAPFFRNKTVTVVGGGNSAISAAILCSSYASKVYLIHRGESLRGDQILVDKVLSDPKIEVIFNQTISKITGENKVKNIELDSGKILDCDGVFVEIGYIIRREIVENLVDTDAKNQIITNSNQETSVPGIFAAGDVTTTPYKQVVISAGEGAKAALSAYSYIQKIDGTNKPSIDWH